MQDRYEVGDVSSTSTVWNGYGGDTRTAIDVHHWTWLILEAHSRTASLTSSDPRDVSQIDFRSYAIGGKEDLNVTYEGIQLARRMMAAAEPFVRNPDGTITEELPRPEEQTEAKIKQWMRNDAW
ncbi:hypothetical protein BJ912DRAFT_1100003 [Pholiota molesta]|nr:hypothetical protein BJ912DRAFT_1100003 [Pholiota molesta]